LHGQEDYFLRFVPMVTDLAGGCSGLEAFDSAKNRKRQRRKRQCVTAKR